MLVFGKHLVSFWYLVHRNAVRNEKARINFALYYQVEQVLCVFLDVGLTHFKIEPLAKRHTKWQILHHSDVYAWDRNIAAISTTFKNFSQYMRFISLQFDCLKDIIHDAFGAMTVRFHAHGIDASIRAAT